MNQADKIATELRLRHLDVMERITQINLSTEKFEDVLSELLELVMDTFESDRASLLYPCDPNAPSWGVPMERTRDKWPGLFALGIEMPQTPEISDVFRELLQAAGPLQYGPFSPRPVPPSVAKKFSVQSQMQILLRPKVGKPWALVMHHCAAAQDYSPEIIHLFSAVAKRISDSLSALISINQLRESEERLQLVLAGSNDGWWDRDMQNDKVQYSARWWSMLGYAVDELPGDSGLWYRLMHPDDVDHVEHTISSALRTMTATEYQVEFRLRHKDGHYIPILARGHIRRDDAGKPLRISGTNMDITARKEAEAALQYAANYDALTQLPNRRMFLNLLAQEIENHAADGSRAALLFIDLDRFKEVNDTLGHQTGDLLLIEAAQRISTVVGINGTVARLGGDEFTVILKKIENRIDIDRIAQAILTAIAAPFQLGEERPYISASIGITLFPDDATGVENMVKYADQAMYAAKNSGSNRHSYFTQSLQRASENRLRLITSLHGALADSQFHVYYQPIIELSTNSIHKAEALVRWHHPVHGLVNPAEFIPLAEQTGMILEIGDWIFREAARQAKRWRAERHPHFQISVNVSPVQFQQEGNLDEWMTFLRQLALPGESIAIEITEGLLLGTTPNVTSKLLTFGDAGIQISLDDFGTGYSSMSYLKKFDIDYIKIDRSFVSNLEFEPDDRVLCEAIIVMAHKLGLKVVAEGVETEGQRRMLIEAGCDYAQGFFFSRPVPADEMITTIDWGDPENENMGAAKFCGH